MSVETFNACGYLVDRQVEAGLGKIQRVVVREVVAQRLGKSGE